MTDSMQAIAKERIYLFAPAACILMRVTFPNLVSADDLQSAIGRAAARQATLCSGVLQSPNGSAFFAPCDPPAPRVCLLRPEETLQTVMQREMRTPFALERGEWMRHYLTEADGKSVWLLACHHMAGDGRALLYFVGDVTAALREPVLTWERQPFALCTAEGAAGALSAPMRWGLHAINRQWEKTKRIFDPADRARLADAYWADRSLSMVHATVEAARLETVLRACREHHVTLTAAWLASVLGSAQGIMDAGIAVDIRPEGLTAMANWATGVSVRCRADGGEFWHAAQKIHRLMRQKLENPRKRDFLLSFLQTLSPTLIDAAYFAAFDGLQNDAAQKIGAMFGYNGRPKSCSVTNLLRAPLADDAVEQIVFYPPMVPNAKRLFGMVTANGNLEITLQSFAEEPETQALLEQVLARLLQACEA